MNKYRDKSDFEINKAARCRECGDKLRDCLSDKYLGHCFYCEMRECQRVCEAWLEFIPSTIRFYFRKIKNWHW